jgi:hypothetical protein
MRTPKHWSRRVSGKRIGGLKFITRRRSVEDRLTPAGDQKVTERHPERSTSKPGPVAMIGVLMQPNRYSGADLRQIRKEKGVGRPPLVNLARRKESA